MPCLKIFTNLPKNFVPADFAQKIIPVLARVLRKPEDKFIVMLSADSTDVFSGQSASTPGAVATLESIGNLGIEENKIITKEISTFIQKELGVAPEHFFLTFYDLCPQDVAKGGHAIEWYRYDISLWNNVME